MMFKRSKTLDDLVKSDPRVNSWYHDFQNGYWVDLEDGYSWDGCGSIHEDTVKEVLNALKSVGKDNEEN